MKNIYSDALKKLKTYEATPEQLLAQAEEVYQLCLITGIETDKVAGKEFVTLIERTPGVAVQAINTKLAIVKFCEDQLEKQGNIDGTPLDINIKVKNG